MQGLEKKTTYDYSGWIYLASSQVFAVRRETKAANRFIFFAHQKLDLFVLFRIVNHDDAACSVSDIPSVGIDRQSRVRKNSIANNSIKLQLI